MQRAAKLTKQTDLLNKWLETSSKTLPKQSLHLFNIRAALADLFYPVLGDVEKSKALRREILAMKVKAESSFEDIMNVKRTTHRMRIAKILFCEFQQSPDPRKKKALI